MGKLKLALFGSTSYMDRLMNCIQRVGPGYLEVTRCTTVDAALCAQPDVVLCERDCEEDARLFSEGTISITLSDMQAPQEGEIIFRYQQGQEILRQIFRIYQRHGGRMPYLWHGNGPMEMTVIYALGGHEMEVLFAMTYALVQGNEKKVLYINLSEFSGMMTLVGDSSGENLSDLVFGVRHSKERFSLYLQSVLHHQQGVDYVQPPENPCDLYEMEKGDISSLLQMLSEQTDYDLIVWNCDCISPVTWQLMESSTRVYCLCKESVLGKYRQEEMKHFIEKDACGQLHEKLRYVSLATTKSSLTKGVQVWDQLQQGDLAAQVRQIIQEEGTCPQI